MGKKVLNMFLVIGTIMVTTLSMSCTKESYVIYSEKRIPLQACFDQQWQYKDSIESYIYRDTLQIMLLNKSFAFFSPKGLKHSKEELPVFARQLQVKGIKYFVHIRNIGSGYQWLYCDVYKHMNNYWELQTCCTAAYFGPIKDIVIDDAREKVFFTGHKGKSIELPFHFLD